MTWVARLREFRGFLWVELIDVVQPHQQVKPATFQPAFGTWIMSNSTDSTQDPAIKYVFVFTTIMLWKLSQWHARSARVVLPEPPADVDTDEEAPEERTVEEIDDGDFLADFPEDTEASTHDFLSSTSTAWLFSLIRSWNSSMHASVHLTICGSLDFQGI